MGRFQKQAGETFSSVEYIVHRYSILFLGLDMDKLNEQFLTYQLLVEEDFPTSVKESVGLEAEDPYRVDIPQRRQEARHTRKRI